MTIIMTAIDKGASNNKVHPASSTPGEALIPVPVSVTAWHPHHVEHGYDGDFFGVSLGDAMRLGPGRAMRLGPEDSVETSEGKLVFIDKLTDECIHEGRVTDQK